MDFALVELVASWQDRGLGLVLTTEGFTLPPQQDHYMCCLCWADDIYPMATSAAALTTMISEFTEHMERLGLEIQTDKTNWCSTDPHAPMTIHVDGFDLVMADKEPGIKVLGSWVSFTGSCQPEYRARHSAAWSSFFKHKNMFCHKEVSYKQKLHLLQLIIRPCVLWAVCTLTLTQKFLRSLDVLQISMITIMTRRARDHTNAEGWLEWYINTRREAKNLLLRYNYRPWSSDAQFFYFCWAGHLARLPEHRAAAMAHRYRNLLWWRHRQDIIELFGGHLGRHPAVFNTRGRWEARLARVTSHPACKRIYNASFESWYDLAQDRELWKLMVQSYLATPGAVAP